MKSISLIHVLLLIFRMVNFVGYSNQLTKEKYAVTINSFGSNIADTNKTYIIKLGDSMKGELDDLVNQQYIKCIEEALKSKNYNRINDTTNNSYKYIIEFDFNISKPEKKIKSKNTPILGVVPQQTATSDIQTTKTNGIVATDAFNNTTFQSTSTTTSEPNPYILPRNNFGIVGYNHNNITETEYQKTLNLSCFLKTDTKTRKIWLVDAKNVSSSQDLRKYIPILSFSIINFIEFDSQHQIELNFTSKDEKLLEFLNRLEAK